jgi:nicotinate-nucleotide adenylyltransferase
VVFVPTGRPWQKAEQEISDPEHRYLMTVVATAANPVFTVSRVDIDRPGATYTIDTLRELHAEHPEADLFFITGADALQNILTWKDTEEIFRLAHFVGVTRPGHELDTSGLPDDGVTLIEVPAMAISSTDCRTRVAAGAPVWYLVPDGVVQYIAKTGMYRNTEEVYPSYSQGNPDAEPDVDWGTHRFPPGWF